MCLISCNTNFDSFLNDNNHIYLYEAQCIIHVCILPTWFYFLRTPKNYIFIVHFSSKLKTASINVIMFFMSLKLLIFLLCFASCTRCWLLFGFSLAMNWDILLLLLYTWVVHSSSTGRFVVIFTPNYKRRQFLNLWLGRPIKFFIFFNFFIFHFIVFVGLIAVTVCKWRMMKWCDQHLWFVIGCLVDFLFYYNFVLRFSNNNEKLFYLPKFF